MASSLRSLWQRSIATVILFGLMASANLAAGESGQRIYPVGHPVYRYLEAAYRNAGRVLPEVTYPASGAQIDLYLGLLQDATLSEAGEYYVRQAYACLDGSDGPGPVLEEEDLGLRLEFDPQLALECRLDQPASDERLLERPIALLNLDSRVAMGPFYGELDVAVRQEPFHGELAPANFTNIPSKLLYVDFNFPQRAFVAFGGNSWLFQLGRDRVSWGTSHSGSLTYSGDAEYLEFARLSAFFRSFSYTWVFLRLEPYVASPDELPVDGPYVPPFFLDDGSGGIASPAAHYRVWRKSVVTHRFTFRPWERIRFSLMESSGIGGYEPDLRILNPFMILHNHFDFSLMTFAASAEVTVAPFAGFELYGQWYMNDFLLPQEAAAGCTEPNAMAVLCGLQYQRALTVTSPEQAGSGIPVSLAVGGEFFYGDPYVYIRESVLRNFTYRHRVITNYDESGAETLGRIVWRDGYLGSPFGNDSVAWLAFATLDFGAFGRVEAQVLQHYAGELGPADILIPSQEATLERTPTGTVERITELAARAQLSSDGLAGIGWDHLTIETGVTGCLRWTHNVNHNAGSDVFQGAMGVTVGAHWRN